MDRADVAMIASVSLAVALAMASSWKRTEGFGVSVGIERIRTGMRGIGEVPAVRMPGSTRGPESGLVPVERSPVWLEMFASATDDVLRSNDEHSLAEVVWNEDHPMARYVLELDALALDLPGPLKAAAALRTPFAELEARALGRPVRIAAEGARVFAIPETYSVREARALYDLLYAATLVKLAHENRHAISAIFAAASDLEALRKESAKKLETIDARGSRQREEAVAETQSRWATFDSERRGEAEAAAQAVAAKARSLGESERGEQALVSRRDSESARASNGRRSLLQAEAAIEAGNARLRALSEEAVAAKGELARVEEDTARMAEEVERAEAEAARVADLRRIVGGEEARVRALEARAEGIARERAASRAALYDAGSALETERARARGARDRADAAREEERSAKGVLASEQEAEGGEAVGGRGPGEVLAMWRRYTEVLKMQAEVDMYDQELRSA
jgi:hypothetical protein